MADSRKVTSEVHHESLFNSPEPIVLVEFNTKSARYLVLFVGKSTRYRGLLELLSFEHFNKSARFFIDYHSKLVL
jgi:hypothetical protein